MPTLNWIGKDAVVNHHHQVPFHLLKDIPELACGEPGTGNLIVQGDNLIALKALLPYYAGQVKCVYIDPPYNTGNEKWVYNDNVNSPIIREWLGKVVGKEDETLDRHDRWLCMMYPRLVLLKKLLRSDGVIFISIGEDEVGNLRLLCDEIFGRSCRLETFIWLNEGNTENAEAVTAVHDYILAYTATAGVNPIRTTVDPNVDDDSKLLRDFAENSIIKNGPANPASVIELPIGFPCQAENLTLEKHHDAEKIMARGDLDRYLPREIKGEYGIEYPIRLDDLVVVNGELQKPCRVYSGWSSARKLRNFIGGNLTPILDDDGSRLTYYLTQNGVPYYRREGRVAHFVPTVLRNMGSTEKDSNALERMGIEFDYPKPVRLVRYLFELTCNPDDIVLDSFSGSGTSGHAALANPSSRFQFVLLELERRNALQIQKRLKGISEGYLEKRKKTQREVPGIGGGFRYCELGEPLFNEAGKVRDEVKFPELARHVWFSETGEPLPFDETLTTPLIGIFRGTGIYLLYNGILGDESVDGGNVLTRSVLTKLPAFSGHKIIYCAGCLLGEDRLESERITIRQTPYEIKVA